MLLRGVILLVAVTAQPPPDFFNDETKINCTDECNRGNPNKLCICFTTQEEDNIC
jgi:hypothetical protein